MQPRGGGHSSSQRRRDGAAHTTRSPPGTLGPFPRKNRGRRPRRRPHRRPRGLAGVCLQRRQGKMRRGGGGGGRDLSPPESPLEDDARGRGRGVGVWWRIALVHCSVPVSYKSQSFFAFVVCTTVIYPFFRPQFHYKYLVDCSSSLGVIFFG